MDDFQEIVREIQGFLASQIMWLMVVASILNMTSGNTGWVNTSIKKIEFEVSVQIQEKFTECGKNNLSWRFL